MPVGARLGSPAQEKGKEPEEKKKAKFGVAPPPPLPRGEYKVTTVNSGGLEDQDIEKELNALGGKGWELVSTASFQSEISIGNVVNTRKQRMVFKRPKQ